MSRKVIIPCAAALLAAFLGLAVADNARPWKRLQAEYLELERREIRSRLDAARSEAAARLNELRAGIRAAAEALAGRRDETEQLELERKRLRVLLRAATRRQGRVTAELERARRLPGRTEEPADAAALAAAARQARMEVESLGELLADRENKLAAVRADLEAARERWARERAPIDDLERQLAALGRRPLLPWALFSSGVAVRQVRVADFPENGGAERVDRCTTCHLGSGSERSSESAPRLFLSHPRLELFAAAVSPHPLGRFGCTVCHGGAGRATDFSRAGHLPRTGDQEAAWRREYGWRREALPSRPMLPLDLSEAACGRCHGAEVWTPAAPTLDAGRRLIVRLGCTGCHASDHPALEGEPKAGPSLLGVAAKTRPAWAYRWLRAPGEADSASAMPHFFDLDGGDDDDRARLSTEIRAVVHGLWERSRPAAYEPPPPGDAEAGRALFHRVGCAACHLLDPAAPAGGALEQRHGPPLARIGSKVAAPWLYAWLRDPRAYRHDTPMPSLRLDEAEAADLTAFLMTRRDPAWENLELPAIDAAARDALVLSHLEGGRTLEASRARLDAMSDRERNSYLGERTIAHQGCHGCHEIAGFEAAPAPGPPLAAAGPRRLKASHRPAYRLSDAERRAVDVALIGLAGERPAASGPRAAALAAGRRVMARHGCRGCHRIEGSGEIPAGRPMAPDLAHAGARLESSWLAAYLADPGGVTVRPWLGARMPSFRLSDHEISALVSYFAVRDGREIFTRDASPADLGRGEAAVGVAVGKVVFGMLQCRDCHESAGDAGPGRELAPSYVLARGRLRRDWVEDWILRPERWFPDTSMPASFQGGEEGAELDSTFLIGSIDTPIFGVERDRLRRLLGSDDALYAYLSDPERVAAALTDYLWTLGD